MDALLKQAVIVAAHPDDEILWFSSIIEEVKQIVVCYMEQDSKPDWTAGRSRVLASYPLANIHALHLKLSEVFDRSDWQYPRTTPFGLEIFPGGTHRHAYEANYRLLKDRLKDVLRSCSHVFTHNPWGEYGHEEHVQVFRAVQDLQQQLGFTLWTSNYVSNRSVPLMMNSLKIIGGRFHCRPTNKALAAQVRDLYIKHGCWTWYPEFQWRDEEAFLEAIPPNRSKGSAARSFPLNFVDIGKVGRPSPFIDRTDKLVSRLSRIRNRIIKSSFHKVQSC